MLNLVDLEDEFRGAADEQPPKAARARWHRAKVLIEEIAIAGVSIGAAFAFPPPPRPAGDEIGWTTDTDDVEGW